MILAYSVLFKSPMRSYRTPQTKKQQEKMEPSADIKKQQQKAAILCLKNAFEGVQKRIKSQIITKLIFQSAKTDKKNYKVKFIAHFASSFLKRKKQSAFDKLLRLKMKNKIMEKAVTNLALKYRRLQKNSMRSSIQKLRNNHSESKVQMKVSGLKKSAARRGSRLSEESQISNILSVSEDSLSESKIVEFEDRREYGNVDVSALRAQNQEIKKMALSKDIKENLLKMQRFNRFTYNVETEKILKEPVMVELRRLQRIKNQNKQMRTKNYDNELMINCLNNHVRMICQMNKDMAEATDYKEKCSEVEKKMRQAGLQHKRQIDKFKRKLISAGIKDSSFTQSVEQSFDKVVTESFFSHDETTILNVLSSAIKAKKYKDMKRQIEQFMKKSDKKQFILIFRQLLTFTQEIQTEQQKSKTKDKDKNEIVNNINLIDKYLRTEKPDELVTLKNKIKNQSNLREIFVLIQTVSEMAIELKRLKKKDSSSTQKQNKYAQKQKLSRSIETENQELKKQLKILQAKYNQLEMDQQKMRESFRKSQRSHPSLMPKKPVEKEHPVSDSKNDEMTKKMKDLELSFQKKLQNMTKQTSSQLQKAKQIQQKQQKRIKDLAAEMQKKDGEASQFKQISKEMNDFKKYYQVIKKKITSKENFTREVNEFKRYHGQSPLLEIFTNLSSEQSSKNTLFNQLKNIEASYNDNSWKRKQNVLLLKTQGQLSTLINQILEKLLSLSKDKEASLSLQKQHQNLKIREGKFKQENTELKEQIKTLKQESRIQKRQSLHESQYSVMAKTEKSEKSQQMQTKTPDRIIQRTKDRQLSGLKTQNERLKKQLQEKSKASTPFKSTSNFDQQTKQKKKETDQAIQCFENIKIKRHEGQSYKNFVNTFRRKYPESIFTELFQMIEHEDQAQLTLTNQMKTTASSFLDGSWKRKQQKLLFQAYSDLYLHFNNIIEITLNICNKHEEQVVNKKKEETKQITLTKYLNSIVSAFNDGSWKRKQNNLLLKEQTQVNNLINQVTSLLLTLMKEKEQNSKNLQQFETVLSKNSTLTSDLSTLKEQNTKLRNENSSLSKQKAKSLERASPDKQQQAQVQKYKLTLEQKQVKIKSLETQKSQLQEIAKEAKQYQQFIKLQQIIKGKKEEGQSYQREMNDFKKKYPQSLLKDILLTIQSKESEIASVVNHVQNIVSIFSQGNWKTRKNINIKQTAQYHQYLNQLIELLITTNKEKDEAIIKGIQATKEVNASVKQQTEELKKQIGRLKTQNKSRSESAQSREKLTAQKQKVAQQTQQLNKLKISFDTLQNQNKRIKSELQNAIKTNTITNKDFDGISEELQRIKKQNNKLKQNDPKLRNKESQMKQLQHTIKELQLLMEKKQKQCQQFEAKLKKEKQEKENLYLLIDEKRQDYENSQENQETFMKEKEEKERKLTDLMQRYQETQFHIKKIQGQVDRLMKQREILENDQQKLGNQNQLLREKLSQKQNNVLNLQQQTRIKAIEMDKQSSVKATQIVYLKKQIKILDEQNRSFKEKNMAESSKEKMEIQLPVRQQEIVKVESKSGSMFLEDHQKLQLRKQLELTNQQLAQYVRNSETQKREMRQYIQKINNELQMQTVLSNEQKKILRENIERARNEEYEINHEKIRALRQQISSYRDQNQRLRSIIDTNQNSFNQLIQEHREMSLKIGQLTDSNEQIVTQNTQLVAQISSANRDKDGMSRKLQLLEETVSQLQSQINEAVKNKNETFMVGSQVRSEEVNHVVATLTEQKKILESKYFEQNQNIIELHKNFYRMESELNSYKFMTKSGVSNHSFRQGSGDYSRYLEEKIKSNENEVRRLMQNEKNLIGKIQNLMQNVSSFERERIEHQSIQREKEFELRFNKENYQKQLQSFKEKINNLEQKLSRKEQDLILQKSQQNSQPNVYHELQMNLKRMEDQNRKINNENNKLKSTIEELNSDKIQLQNKLESNSSSSVEVRIMNNKYTDLQTDYRKLQHKLHSYQQQINRLRSTTHNVEPRPRGGEMEFFNQRIVVQKKDEQILWLKNQLSAREMEIQKLRNSQLQLIHQGKRYQEKINSLEQLQIKYNRQCSSHQETRRNINQLEQFYKGQMERQRVKERQTNHQLLTSQEQLRLLNQNYQQLSMDYKRLQEDAETRKTQGQALKSIVFQLDQTFTIEGSQEQLQLKILRKISNEISELIQSNRQLKFKCQSIENSMFSNSTQISDQNFVYSLHSMTEDLLLYLKEQQLINPEEVSTNLKQLLIDSNNSTEIYLSNMTVFLKTLILTINRDRPHHEQNINNIIQNIRKAFQNFQHANNEESFNILRQIIYS